MEFSKRGSFHPNKVVQNLSVSIYVYMKLPCIHTCTKRALFWLSVVVRRWAPHLCSHLWSTRVSLAELLLKTAAEVMFDIALTRQVCWCARACSGGYDRKLTACMGLPVPGQPLGDNSDRLCNTSVTFLLVFLLYWQLLLLAQPKMNLSSAEVWFPQQCCCQCVF